MRLKLTTTFLWMSLVAATVTMASPYALAQNTCEKVFAKASAYRDSFAPLKSVHNTTEDLVTLLKTKPQEFTSKSLEAEVRKLENLAEAYFESAGISFEKLSTATTIKDLKDEPEYTLFYGIYRLTGSAFGDEAARLIHGIQINPKYENQTPTFVFDPLYSMNYDSSGHFSPGSKSILIGPQVLGREVMGLGSTLRHEIQHAIERAKLANGKMTLARASFSGAAATDHTAYSDFLSADELETHIRDIRILANMNLWKSRDAKLAKVTSEENLNIIKKARQETLTDKAARLEILISKSMAVIKNLEGRKPAYTTINNKTGGVEAHFLGLPPPYSIAKFEFLGILSPETMNNSEKVETVIKKFLTWEKARTEQIAKELKDLTQKY